MDPKTLCQVFTAEYDAKDLAIRAQLGRVYDAVHAGQLGAARGTLDHAQRMRAALENARPELDVALRKACEALASAREAVRAAGVWIVETYDHVYERWEPGTGLVVEYGSEALARAGVRNLHETLHGFEPEHEGAPVRGGWRVARIR